MNTLQCAFCQKPLPSKHLKFCSRDCHLISQRGNGTSWSKLDPEKVRQIRKLYRTRAMTIRAMAVKFNVHRSSIENAAKRITWRNVIDEDTK